MFFSNSADQNFFSIRLILVISEVRKTIDKILSLFWSDRITSYDMKKVGSGYPAKRSEEFRKLITIEVNQIMTFQQNNKRSLYWGIRVR